MTCNSKNKIFPANAPLISLKLVIIPILVKSFLFRFRDILKGNRVVGGKFVKKGQLISDHEYTSRQLTDDKQQEFYPVGCN